MITEDNAKKHQQYLNPIKYVCLKFSVECLGKEKDLVLVSHNHNEVDDTNKWTETWKCSLCGTEFTI